MYSFFNPSPNVPEVSVDELAARLESGEEAPFLLDVREPDEWDEAHIEEATLIPLRNLSHRAQELPRDREIVCICRSGQRSGMATQALVRAGYDAKNMAGGMLEWMRHGHPTASGSQERGGRNAAVR